MIQYFSLAHKEDPKSTTTPGQSGSGSSVIEGVLHIPQSPRTEATPSEGLVSYPRHSSKEGVSLRRDAGGVFYIPSWSYLPTPPLGQDMTQGQFLSGV